MSDFFCVFLNGTVGVGKSTTAEKLAVLAEHHQVPHVVIDLDYIRRAWPAPSTDPFHHELELKNLRALAANYREAGVKLFILAGVIEHATEIPRYAGAVGVDKLTIIRLETALDELTQRLNTRHAGNVEDLQWHLRRAPELAAILKRADLDDASVDTTRRSPAQVAEHVWQLLSIS